MGDDPLPPTLDSTSLEPEPLEPPPPLHPMLTASGRPQHNRRLPRRFNDNLPEAPAALPRELQPDAEAMGSVHRVLLL